MHGETLKRREFFFKSDSDSNSMSKASNISPFTYQPTIKNRGQWKKVKEYTITWHCGAFA